MQVIFSSIVTLRNVIWLDLGEKIDFRKSKSYSLIINIYVTRLNFSWCGAVNYFYKENACWKKWNMALRMMQTSEEYCQLQEI